MSCKLIFFKELKYSSSPISLATLIGITFNNDLLNFDIKFNENHKRNFFTNKKNNKINRKYIGIYFT